MSPDPTRTHPPDPLPPEAADLTRTLAPADRPTNTHTPESGPAAELPDAGPGRRFADYELLEELARGGMGVVYRARQVSLNRVVALKMIVKGELATPADVARFRAEAEAVASLDHPNIVPIYDVGEHEGYPYFTMRFVEGGSLADSRKAVASAADNRRAAALVAAIARAVHFAHQRGIIHRDLKPANILLGSPVSDSNPGPLTVVPFVADFGLAKRLESDATRTASGAVLGTPSFMPPEQARGDKHLTTSADVYAVGAILYDLLTGKPPFTGANSFETIKSVLEREATNPQSLNTAVDRDLAVIALKCLEKTPARRYASAEAVAEELDRWLRGEAIRARPVSRAERAWRWVKRNPGGTAAIAAALLIGTGLTASALAFANYQQRMNKELTQALADAEASRKEAQRQTANIAVDLDLRECQAGDRSLGLLRLAKRLGVIPTEETALRESVMLNLLAWGQRTVPAFKPWTHEGTDYEQSDVAADGRAFVTWGKDNTVRLWDLTVPGSQACKVIPAGPYDGIPTSSTGYRIRKDGGQLLTRTSADAFAVWELPAGNQVGHVRGVPPQAEVSWSEDGTVIFSDNGRTGELHVWRVGALDRGPVVLPHPGLPAVDEIAEGIPNPPGRFLVTWCNPGSERHRDDAKPVEFALWDLDRPAPVKRWPAAVWKDLVFRLHPGGGSVVVLDRERKTLDVLSTATGERVATLATDAGECRKIAFREDGGLFAAAFDTEIRLWNAQTWQPAREPCRLRVAGTATWLHFVPKSETIVLRVNNNNGPNGTNIIRPGRAESFGLTTIDLDVFSPTGRYARDGAQPVVVDLETGSRVPLRDGRNFADELGEFALDGGRRFARVNTGTGLYLCDLTTEKLIGPDVSGNDYPSPEITFAGRPGGGAKPSDGVFYIAATGDHRIVLPTRPRVVDPAVCRLWVELLTGAELGADGFAKRLPEDEWHRRRDDFRARLEGETGIERDIMNAVVGRPSHWLAVTCDELVGLGKFEEAMPFLDRLVAEDPRAENFVRRAEVFEKRKQPEPFVADRLRARELDPKTWSPADMNTWAWDQAKQAGRDAAWYRAAARVAEVLHREAPFDHNYTHTLGAAYYRLGRFAEALETLRRAHAEHMAGHVVREQFAPLMLSPWAAPAGKYDDPGQPAYLAFLALAHAKVGQKAEAVEYARQYRIALRNPRWKESHASDFLVEVEQAVGTGK